MAEYKYIVMEFTGPYKDGKTLTYNVRNKKSYALLGCIIWYSHWRQYCFFPERGIVLSIGCLHDIASFIEDEMTAYKKHREKVKEEMTDEHTG